MRCLPGFAIILLLPLSCALAEPVSGYAFLDESTQAMQDDEFENPGMVAVDRGSELFNEHREAEEYRCSDCHGEDGADLDIRQIARYPVFNPNLGGLVTLQERINYCWEISMDRFPLTAGHADLIALETFVRNRARGEQVDVQTDGEMAPLIARGEALYNTRFGQLDMACRHCHVQHQGQMLRGQRLSQGQANGFTLLPCQQGFKQRGLAKSKTKEVVNSTLDASTGSERLLQIAEQRMDDRDIGSCCRAYADRAHAPLSCSLARAWSALAISKPSPSRICRILVTCWALLVASFPAPINRLSSRPTRMLPPASTAMAT